MSDGMQIDGAVIALGNIFTDFYRLTKKREGKKR